MPKKQSGGSPASSSVMKSNQEYVSQLGGSPASDNVTRINSGYIKAINEIPANVTSCQTGGSPSSELVLSNLKSDSCGSTNMPETPKIAGNPNNLALYKTSGGGKKKSKKSKKHIQKAGGSDFVNLLYARGPVNNPSNPALFKAFAGPYDQYISNECMYYEGLGPNSASNAAPFPFPQKGGKRHSATKKHKSHSSKSKHTKRGKKAKLHKKK